MRHVHLVNNICTVGWTNIWGIHITADDKAWLLSMCPQGRFTVTGLTSYYFDFPLDNDGKRLLAALAIEFPNFHSTRR